MTDTITQAVARELLLENQQTIAERESTIAELQAAISKCEADLGASRKAPPDAGPLLVRRADLLAESAMGADVKAQLKELDAEIANVEKQRTSAKPGIDTLEQTAQGLRRKLESEQANLESLRTMNSKLQIQLLRSAAEELGTEYVQAAQKLSDTYKRLIAMGDLLRQRGSASINAHRVALFIPRFRLESVPVTSNREWEKDVWFSTEHLMGAEVAHWVENEKATLLATGVQV